MERNHTQALKGTRPRRGRPRLKESPSRGFIVKAARQLLLTDGYKKTSVEAICKKAGTSKMTFYRHFNDKMDLVFIIVQDYIDREVVWNEALLAKDMKFRDKMSAMLAKRQKNVVSPEPKLIAEVVGIETPATKKFWKSIAKQIETINLKFFYRGQQEGVISDQLTPELFLYFVKKRNEFFIDPELKKICPSKKQRLEVVDNFLYKGFSQ